MKSGIANRAVGHREEIPPCFISAIVKTQASCPDNFVQSRVCRYITNGDIGSLNGPARRATMMKAEQILRSCRSLLAGRDIPEKEVTKLVSRLDTQMIRTVLKKDNKFETPNEVGDQFVKEANAAIVSCNLPATSMIRSSRAAAPAKAASSSVSASSNASWSDLVQYKEDGTAEAGEKMILEAAG